MAEPLTTGTGRTLLINLAAALAVSWAVTPAHGATMAERRAAFRSLKLGMFIHFNMSTFHNVEWDDPARDPLDFNPKYLDCTQWADAAVSAGMKYAVLTAKHHDGFCLWSSAHTTYDIDSSSYHGDLVQDYATAFRSRGLKVGIYFSILDWHHGILTTDGDEPGDVTFIENQLAELLTGYGTIDLLWFDGSSAFSNFSGSGTVYPDIRGHIASLSPDTLVIVNNAHDFASTDIISYECPLWQTPDPVLSNTLPAEATFTLQESSWFWKTGMPSGAVNPHAGGSVAGIVQKIALYEQHNSNTLLNVGPNALGLIDVNASAWLRGIGGAPVPADTPAPGTNLALGCTASQSTEAYGGTASRAIDGDINGEFGAGSVTHTAAEAQPWWQVDLGAVGDVGFIELWNRTDSYCGYRLADFCVFVSDVPFTSTDPDLTSLQPGVWTHHFTNVASRLTTIPASRTGRYVRVQITDTVHEIGVPVGTTTSLHLAEVRVIEGTGSAPGAGGGSSTGDAGFACTPREGEGSWAAPLPALAIAYLLARSSRSQLTRNARGFE